VTDYKFGSTHVLYSTPAVLLSATIDGKDWLVVHGNPSADSVFEVSLVTGNERARAGGDFKVSLSAANVGFSFFSSKNWKLIERRTPF
jgi:hypothetical protein